MVDLIASEKIRLEKTIAGILDSKKMKEHRVIRHRWNFEPPDALKINRDRGVVTAEGRFTHYLKFARDDVVRYSFKIEGGKVKDLSYNYEDRGWSEVVELAVKAAEIAGKLKEAKEKREKIQAALSNENQDLDDVNNILEGDFDGEVDEEGMIIVANIAKALQLKEAGKLMLRRASTTRRDHRTG